MRKVLLPSQIIWKPRELEIDDKYLPLVSFIIPTLNSEQVLEKCLRSIAEQDYPSIEVIIVDGGSSDNTISVATKYNAKILKCSRSLAAARQLGLYNASGEIIANWDSDIYIPHKDWLRKAVKTLLSYSDASTLWVYNTYPPYATLFQKAFSWYSWETMLEFAKRSIGFWGGGNSLFYREAIRQVGGFNEDLDTGEDFELAKRLFLKGYKVIFYKEYVFHDTFKSFREMVRKDIRRAKDFKRASLASLTGVPLSELIRVNLKIGLLTSIKNLFVKKEAYFGIVPIVVLLRLIVYAIMYLLP